VGLRLELREQRLGGASIALSTPSVGFQRLYQPLLECTELGRLATASVTRLNALAGSQSLLHRVARQGDVPLCVEPMS